MKKFAVVIASVLMMSLCVAFHANAATVERTVSPSGHVIDSFYMMCRVVDVDHEENKDVVFVEDNSGNCWSFYDVEIGYWKKGDKMTCVFDYCETCETLELNGVVG